MTPRALPVGTRIGTVVLRVGDVERQRAFYRDVVGLTLLGEEKGTATLGTPDGRPLLVLLGSPGAPRRPHGTTGLFHVAILLPARAGFVAAIRRVRRQGWRFDGFADHHVSEAAYLTDPEGNGLELYVDRPREAWRRDDGMIFMTTEPLDVPGLLAAHPGDAERLPEGTAIGHVHLRVSSLAAAEAFYVDRLGFEVVTRAYPGALFVAAGGYHHHLGLNVWGGGGAARPPEGSLGLVSFDVVVPTEGDRRRVAGPTGAEMLLDADDNGVRIVGGPDASDRPSTPTGGS